MSNINVQDQKLQRIDLKDDFKSLNPLPRKKEARTIALDKTTYHLYLPNAKFEPALEGTRRPPMKQGTFMVLNSEIVFNLCTSK